MSGSQFAPVLEGEPDMKGRRCGYLWWFKRAILMLLRSSPSGHSERWLTFSSTG